MKNIFTLHPHEVRILKRCFFIAAVLLILFLAGCSGSSGQTETSAPPAAPDFVLAENGASTFVIIRSEFASKEEIAVATALRTLIQEATGVQLTLKEDFLKKGTQYEEAAAEILVGATNRAESAAAGEGLKSQDYRILQQGTRLAIAFGTPEAGMEALERFAADCLFPEQKLAGCTAGYDVAERNEYPLDTIVIGGRDISEFVLVGDEAFTSPVRQKVMDLCGVVLKVTTVRPKNAPCIRADTIPGIDPLSARVMTSPDVVIAGTTGDVFKPSEAAALLCELLDSGSGELKAGLDVEKKVPKNAVKIAYLGGSITWGGNADPVDLNSWRAIVSRWFVENLPDSLVTNINAGIGSTGSFYGSYRVYDDCQLGSPLPPDLMFLEVTANDTYDKLTEEQVKVNVESIIRQAYAANPKMQIIIIHVTDWPTKNTVSTQRKWIAQIADHYGIPQIAVGEKMYNVLLKDNGGVAPTSQTDEAWTKYITDYCHPSNAGHALYAEYIIEFLTENKIAEKLLHKDQLKDAVLPEKTFCDAAKIKDHGRKTTFAAAGFTQEHLKGWTMNAEGAMSPTEADNKVAFEFTGTAVAMQCRATKSSKPLAYTITSKTNPSVRFTGTVTTVDQWSESVAAWPLELGVGLPLDTYLVEFSSTGFTTGEDLVIKSLFINGDVSSIRPVKAAG